VLPALVTRPLRDDDATRAATPAAEPLAARRTLDADLDAGIPARLALDGTRTLVLGIPLGVARAVLALGPLDVVVDTRSEVEPSGTARTLARPRLTLVDAGVIGDTVPVVPGVPQRVGHGGVGVVEVVVDLLVITAGSVRSPGRFGGHLTLRWRPLDTAPSTGAPHPSGDPGIPPAGAPAH
jgi:hypothetical protein